MHKAKRTPRQISLLPSVSRPRSIFRQLWNWVHFRGNSGHFIGLEKKKKKRVQLPVCGGSGKMPCVCVERKEAGRQATEREIEKKEKRKERHEEGKIKQNKKTKNKHECWKHKLKPNTLLAGRALRKETRRRVRMMKSVVFQRRRSRVASRETACQGNSIPRETGEWKTVLNYAV